MEYDLSECRRQQEYLVENNDTYAWTIDEMWHGDDVAAAKSFASNMLESLRKNHSVDALYCHINHYNAMAGETKVEVLRTLKDIGSRIHRLTIYYQPVPKSAPEVSLSIILPTALWHCKELRELEILVSKPAGIDIMKLYPVQQSLNPDDLDMLANALTGHSHLERLTIQQYLGKRNDPLDPDFDKPPSTPSMKACRLVQALTTLPRLKIFKCTGVLMPWTNPEKSPWRLSASSLMMLLRAKTTSLEVVEYANLGLDHSDWPTATAKNLGTTWRNECLHELSLTGNGLSTMDTLALAENLPACAGLKSLDVSDNPRMGEEGRVALESAKEGHGALRFINYGHPGLPPPCVGQLDDEVDHDEMICGEVAGTPSSTMTMDICGPLWSPMPMLDMSSVSYEDMQQESMSD